MPIVTTTDGVELFYELHGNPGGAVKVILVAGLAGSHKVWEFCYQYLSTFPEFQILTIDNRGAGYSQSPPAPYTMARMAEDIVNVADHVGFLNFHLVGVSMGGMIVQHVALTVHQRIQSLTIIVSRCEGGIFNILPTLSGMIRFSKVKKAKTPDETMAATAKLLLPDDFVDGREEIIAMWTERGTIVPAAPEHGKKGQIAAVKHHKLSSKQMKFLKSAEFPILAITGDKDLLVKPKHSKKMTKLIGANLVIVEGAGHGILAQCPDLLNELLHKHFVKAMSENPKPITPSRQRRASSSYEPVVVLDDNSSHSQEYVAVQL
jgi:3-oxoadipate enol-lactonase